MSAPEDVEALADAQSLVASIIFASWGVRSRRGEWTDTETQNAAAKEVLRSLLASGLVVSAARHAAEVQAARAEALLWAIEVAEALCPHGPEDHAEGTCETCDYTFALCTDIRDRAAAKEAKAG